MTIISTAAGHQQSPHWETQRLWSLWDIMLKQAALEWGRVLDDLRLMVMVSGNSANLPLTQGQIHGIKLQLQDTLGNLKRVAILLDLNDELGPEMDRFQAAFAHEDLAQLSGRADHLRNRIRDDLQNEWFFQVDRQDVSFYDKPAHFGLEVTTKFPKAAGDIKNAGNCIALQQPDACIFYLMRAMEVAVRRLSQRIGLTVTHQTTWRVLTGNMDAKIKMMPDTTGKQRAKKDKWSEARANLHQVGQVWRNNTMHPAVSYTRSQARDIFEAVRVFMSVLAQL